MNKKFLIFLSVLFSLTAVFGFQQTVLAQTIPNHLDIVTKIINDLKQQGVNLNGPCGAFQITDRVAWELRSEGAGILSKPTGNNCQGFSTDIVVYKNGLHFDVVGAGGCQNNPLWNSAGLVDPNRWREPINPANLAPVPPDTPPDCGPATGPVPQTEPIQDLGDLVESIFRWALWLVGLAIFVNFLWAGLLWFTAAGSATRVNQAREKMFNALIGAIILLAAYLILNTINPDLVRQTFTLPGL